MIVLLDATELIRDPFCEGIGWRVLAHAASAWKLRIVVSEVVMAEAVAHYQRHVSEARVGYERWIEKHGGPLGLSGVADAAMAAITAASESYGDRLRECLRAAGAEFIEPPDVPHMKLVDRAATRRPPCNAKGDGYRDTLNWLTVLAFAASDPGEEIAWVTSDSQDFANAEQTGFSEPLLNELREVGAEGRVRLIGTIPDLVLALADALAPEGGKDLDAVRNRLRDESVLAYVADQVLAAVGETHVDPRRCGLPVSTKTARIVEVGLPRNLALTVRGAVPGDETVAEFTVEADTALLVELVQSAGIEGDQWTVVSVDAAGVVARVVKPLVFRGLITLARYELPVGAELSRVTALADDPGLAVWVTLPRAGEWLSSFRGSVIPPDVFKNLPLPIIPLDLFKSLQLPIIPPDLFKSLQLPIIPLDLFKSLQLPIIPPDLFKNLQLPIIPLDLFKSLQMPVVPPGVWRYLTERAEEPAPSEESEQAQSPDDEQHKGEGDESAPDGANEDGATDTGDDEDPDREDDPPNRETPSNDDSGSE